jgi:polynucleotide 5'-hydroxyl-kinase GRC3/NOL9
LPELKLKKGDIVRLEGLLNLEVKEGEVTVSGGLHGKGNQVVIPRAKSLPLEAASDALVEYTTGEGGHVEHLSRRTIPPGWDELVQEMVEEKPRVVMVIGNVDVGKTFFTTYVANSLLRHKIRPAVVDSDVGQSDIGPPGTVGLGVLDKPVGLLHEVPTRVAYFVGSMSPSGHMLEFMVGMKKVVERGLTDADTVIVDTPGWVVGGPGRALQVYSAELLDPDLVIALQRGDELEHLLRSIPAKIKRIAVSEKVRERSRGERSFLRQLILARYFEGACKIPLDLRKVKLERCYYSTGKPLDPKSLGVEGPVIHAEKMPEGLLLVTNDSLGEEELRSMESEFGSVKVIKKGSEANVLVALIGEGQELLGVGILDEINYANQKLRVITPVKDAAKVVAVQFGSMKIRPNGEEIGTVRPGSF